MNNSDRIYGRLVSPQNVTVKYRLETKQATLAWSTWSTNSPLALNATGAGPNRVKACQIVLIPTLGVMPTGALKLYAVRDRGGANNHGAFSANRPNNKPDRVQRLIANFVFDDTGALKLRVRGSLGRRGKGKNNHAPHANGNGNQASRTFSVKRTEFSSASPGHNPTSGAKPQLKKARGFKMIQGDLVISVSTEAS